MEKFERNGKWKCTDCGKVRENLPPSYDPQPWCCYLPMLRLTEEENDD